MTKKSKNIDKMDGTTKDSLASLIVDTLNKAQKDGTKVAYFLDDKDDPSSISDWISTGSTLLDLAISNRPNGGLPVGRMVELNGLEGSGKSLIAAHIIANTQKKGGLPVMIDTENAAAPEFWQSLGVDLKNLPYVQLETVEEIFAKLEELIGIIRKTNSDRLVTFIIDSVAAASTSAEKQAGYEKRGYNTDKSLVISMALRKLTGLIGNQRILVVFTNQLRFNMDAVGFGAEKYVVPGGKAIGYHTSVRVRLTSVKKLKKGETIVGSECQAKVHKNRMGPPHRTAKFKIYFDSGISDVESWYNFFKETDKQTGTTIKIDLPSGERKMSSKEFVDTVNSDPAFKDEVYMTICDRVIMKYKSPNTAIEEGVEAVDDESTPAMDD